MGLFEESLQQLNAKQREAVEIIDGPVLVVAGPGTGKTQLLSMRVANLLRQPGVNPSNILCITFTDNAARNMRERLETIIGQAAYHVSIHTFHSFGTDIINQYPDYFMERPLLQPIDELGSYELLRDIFENLAHSNPLSTKVGDEYIFLKDTLQLISWIKQNALTPEELTNILNDNGKFIEAANKAVAEAFSASPSAKQLGAYEKLLSKLSDLPDSTTQNFIGYKTMCFSELSKAIVDSQGEKRYVPLITTWRNRWLEKDSQGDFRFKDGGKNLQKMRSVATVYKKLQASMAERGLFDFNDMIMEVVQALEKHEDLRLNLQEQYQYILIDEFQDTNKAQARIVHALGNNPVNEGRPNIMAVGDDDQAIYAFQGAQSSNMLDFVRTYSEVTLITLTDNYRSAKTILDASSVVVRQADDRLEDLLDEIDKRLTPHAELPVDLVQQVVLPSELQQYQWIAERIQAFLKEGIEPQEIAVIAPKHKFLERLMPYIGAKQIPVAYERRENILDAPIIKQLLTMAELIHAMANNAHDQADALWSEVLTFRFWNVPLAEVAKLSMSCYENNQHWLECMLSHKNPQLKNIAAWMLEGVRQSHTQPLEYMLDRLLGNTEAIIDESENGEPVPIHLIEEEKYHSPMREYYFSDDNFDAHTDDYLSLLGQLATLRHRLRAWQPDKTLYIADLVEFVRLQRQAHLKIIDTNPHTQATNAVQVMTAYKAKGLEFSIVFVINAQDEVWGNSARSRSDRIRVPHNLTIKPAGETISDRLRLLYVALTRTRHSLFITSYTHNLDNKLSLGLSFIGGNSTDSTPLHPAFKPQPIGQVANVEAVEILTTDWAYRFRDIIADKATLFEPILKKYKLSITHLNNFLDITNAGPHYFLVHNLLRFPEAMTPHAAYGDAIHKTIQWIYAESRIGKLPAKTAVFDYFCDMLKRRHLPLKEYKLFAERGREALGLFLRQRAKTINTEAIIERSFGNEGVIVGGAHLTGKIDKMEMPVPGQIEVVDFKTGKPASSWRGRYDYEQSKLHKYKQQLLFYKLLVERSAQFGKNNIVSSGALEFVEADDNGKLVPPLVVTFTDKELQHFEALIAAVWQHIQDLNFPDVSSYPKNFKGILDFENDLINGDI